MMDCVAGRDHVQNAVQSPKHRIGLPLVSIIVVNFNYQRFLVEAIESAISQTYPNIEIIVVDDASTDESGIILDKIEEKYHDISIIRRSENGGQSLASRQGFEASSGDYVVFLDADDVLLPDFVHTHVFVHLSLRVPVGLTSSDMAQAAGERLVLSGLPQINEYVRSGKGKCKNFVRPVDENGDDLYPLSPPDGDLTDRIHFVPPCNLRRWIWAPTSGNCFRRDALAMFIDNDALADLRSCTDAYLVRGITVLTGSVLIDRALSIYRLHGSNVFSKGPNLNAMLNYDRNGPNNDQKGRRMVVDHLIANAGFFGRKVHSPFHMLKALSALNDPWPRMPSRIAGSRSYTGGEVIAHFSQLCGALGLWRVALWTPLLGVYPWALAWAWLKYMRAQQ
jgi:glycosyltransferase involved in cell wall biosynthesis